MLDVAKLGGNALIEVTTQRGVSMEVEGVWTGPRLSTSFSGRCVAVHGGNMAARQIIVWNQAGYRHVLAGAAATQPAENAEAEGASHTTPAPTFPVGACVVRLSVGPKVAIIGG